MAQVSQELIDLLSVDSITQRIDDITKAIEREKILDGASYTYEGDGDAKPRRKSS